MEASAGGTVWLYSAVTHTKRSAAAMVSAISCIAGGGSFGRTTLSSSASNALFRTTADLQEEVRRLQFRSRRSQRSFRAKDLERIVHGDVVRHSGVATLQRGHDVVQDPLQCCAHRSPSRFAPPQGGITLRAEPSRTTVLRLIAFEFGAKTKRKSRAKFFDLSDGHRTGPRPPLRHSQSDHFEVLIDILANDLVSLGHRFGSSVAFARCGIGDPLKGHAAVAALPMRRAVASRSVGDRCGGNSGEHQLRDPHIWLERLRLRRLCAHSELRRLKLYFSGEVVFSRLQLRPREMC
eukprot:scaffold7068_cov301-Pinguiococcus_pyrenoidosus.AAC.5